MSLTPEQIDERLDYPVAPDEGIAPVIYRAMIIQNMALRYLKAMQGSAEPFTLDHAFEAAKATWETDWDTDPAPRTMEAAMQEVDNDLAYWNED